MSTSLNKDLHSVYIDGEMPESFVSQYESIVEKDEKEKSRLERMRLLHNLLQEDSASKTISEDFVNKSFERLQTKMRYAKNIEFASEQKSFIKPFVKYAASFAAAAAVFAVIFVPSQFNSLKNVKETAVAAISIQKQNSIEPIAKKDVIVDGNINMEDLPKILAASSKSTSTTQATANANSSLAKNSISETFIEESFPIEQKTISFANIAKAKFIHL